MTTTTLRRARLAAAAAALCLALPLPAHAQLGGFVKKKLKEAATGQAATPAQQAAGVAASQPGSSPYNEYVLEMTPANLDRLEAGLKAERALRDSVNAYYAKLPTPAEWGNCKMSALQTPEGQKIAESMPQQPTSADMQRMANEIDELAVRKCGVDPNKKSRTDDLRVGSQRAADASGLTKMQYAYMKERVTPFCKAGGASQKIPGDGTNIYYVYSDAEAQALAPRCGTLVGIMNWKTAAK